MANSTQVIALNASIQRKSIYRGNVQAIPITIESQAAGSAEVSEVLTPNTYVILASATASAGNVSLGYSGDTDAISAAGTTSSTNTLVDVSGKTLLATTTATASVDGHILIVTDE